MDLSISFASEQTIDELAHAVGMDPVAFRRRNITDPRWLGVLDAVAQAAGWTAARRPFGPMPAAGSRRAAALRLAPTSCPAARAVADVTVDRQTGEIKVTHLYGALDAGLAVNPALIENQIEGMLTQAASRALIEEVRFTPTNVTSLDWKSYPVLRFADHPEVTPIVVQRLDERSTGAGEEVMGAAVGAIANAVFDAIGVRLRQYPMTPERVRAALS